MRVLPVLLLLPSLAHAGELLDAQDRDRVAQALRPAGQVVSDLTALRDDVNGGLQPPRDRFRLSSADDLDDPFAVVQRASTLHQTLEVRPGQAPGWTGLWAVAQGEYGDFGADPCAKTLGVLRGGLGLVDRMLKAQAAQGDKWSKREAADIRGQVSSELDVALGALLDEAAVAHCRVEASTARIDAEQRTALWSTLLEHLGGARSDAQRDEDAAAFGEAWNAVDRGGLLRAGMDWSESLTEAAVALAGLPATAWPAAPVILPTDLGEVWLGSAASNSGTGDPVLLVDPGGDDQWKLVRGDRAVRGWIDLGGDDSWQGAGGAFFSVAAGVDGGGDDTHRGEIGATGGAAFGVSTWLDGGGADVYQAAALAQGAALFGVGALRDGGSERDVWEARGFAQGFGGPGGLGLAQDLGGDDSWALADGAGQGAAAGVSMRLGGGVGLLVDEDGDDVFAGGIGVQGSAQRGGFGLLFDARGDDRRTARELAQGGCSFGGAGLLIDLTGDDAYLADRGAQGSARHACLGALIERTGQDTYSIEQAGQGSGHDGGLGMLVDTAGMSTLLRAGRERPGEPGLSVAAFALGRLVDSISDEVEPGTVINQGFIGGLVRHDEPKLKGTPSADEAARVLAGTQPGRGAAVGRQLHGWSSGADVFLWLLPKADALRPDQSEALETLLRGHVRAKQMQTVAAIATGLADAAGSAPRTGGDPSAALYLRWLGLVVASGLVPPDAAVAAAEPLCDHPAWPVRQQAFAVLKESARRGPHKAFTGWAKRAAVAIGSDPVPQVRAEAASLLGYVGEPSAASSLGEALRTGSFELRSAAEFALSLIAARTGPSVARVVFPLAEGEPGESSPTRDSGLRILGATGHEEALDVLTEALQTGDDPTRLAALAGAEALGGDAVVEAITALLEQGLSARVDREARAVLEALAPPED